MIFMLKFLFSLKADQHDVKGVSTTHKECLLLVTLCLDCTAPRLVTLIILHVPTTVHPPG
jgi:hypothetical protein